jgi:hypothetical protein
MANRANNAKILKAKNRNKKKRFSIDRTLTPHVKVKSKVQGILSLNRQVRNQVAPPDPYLDVIFPPMMYTEEEILRRCTKVDGWRAANVLPRADVVKRYNEMVAEGETDRRILLTPKEMVHKKIWMHFNTTKSICFLVEIDYKREWMRRSHTYNSPFRVKEIFLHRPRTIQWQQSIPLIGVADP